MSKRYSLCLLIIFLLSIIFVGYLFFNNKKLLVTEDIKKYPEPSQLVKLEKDEIFKILSNPLEEDKKREIINAYSNLQSMPAIEDGNISFDEREEILKLLQTQQ